MPLPHNGGVDLSQVGRATLQSIEVWPAVDIVGADEGVPTFGGEYTIRIVNVLQARCVLIPYGRVNLMQLRDQIDQLLTQGVDQHGT